MTTGSCHVLIVEDNADTRAFIARRFRTQGWAVTVAATVAEGLAALVPAPDCVILDLNLPDGPGEAVLRALRDGNLPVKVVAVVTGITDTLRLSRVAAYRPNLTIMKPFDWDVLLRYCESELRRG